MSFLGLPLPSWTSFSHKGSHSRPQRTIVFFFSPCPEPLQAGPSPRTRRRHFDTSSWSNAPSVAFFFAAINPRFAGRGSALPSQIRSLRPDSPSYLWYCPTLNSRPCFLRDPLVLLPFSSSSFVSSSRFFFSSFSPLIPPVIGTPAISRCFAIPRVDLLSSLTQAAFYHCMESDIPLPPLV